MDLIHAHVHQTVLGYSPGDLVEVDADDELVDSHLTGGQLSRVDAGDVLAAVVDGAEVVTDPPGLIPDVVLADLPNRDAVREFGTEYGVDLTGLTKRGELEAAVEAERQRREEAARAAEPEGAGAGDDEGTASAEE